MKPFKEVIDGIRKAVMASEVREDLAQMGEYVEQFANTAGENIQKAIDPTLSLSGKAADAAKVGEAVGELKEDYINVFTKTELLLLVNKTKWRANQIDIPNIGEVCSLTVGNATTCLSLPVKQLLNPLMLLNWSSITITSPWL